MCNLIAGEGLDLGISRDARFVPIAAKLPEQHVVCRERPRRLEHLHPFVAQRFAVDAGRRFHRKVAQQLEEMILNDIANGAGRVVEAAPAVDAEIFRHRDLHALDVMAVPERLHERIVEAEEQHVVHGPLAQVVIDTEDVALDERAEQCAIQRPGRVEVLAERFLDHDAGAGCTARRGQLLHDRAEERWRNGHVVRGVLGAVQCLPQGREGGCVAIVAVHVLQPFEQHGRRRRDRARRTSRRWPGRGRATGRGSSSPWRHR